MPRPRKFPLNQRQYCCNLISLWCIKVTTMLKLSHESLISQNLINNMTLWRKNCGLSRDSFVHPPFCLDWLRSTAYSSNIFSSKCAHLSQKTRNKMFLMVFLRFLIAHKMLPGILSQQIDAEVIVTRRHGKVRLHCNFRSTFFINAFSLTGTCRWPELISRYKTGSFKSFLTNNTKHQACVLWHLIFLSRCYGRWRFVYII